MPQTSLTAWAYVQTTLTERQSQVLTTLRQVRRATMHGVANQMGVPVHTISGRFSELRKKGMIREFDKVRDDNGIQKIVWEVVG